jgi:polysaccharide pyruvyl transferase WcaK-like protein
MHCSILSAVAGTPMIGLVNAPKIRNFLSNIEQGKRMVELKDSNAEHLLALIQDTLNWREEIVQALAAAIAPWKAQARDSAKLTSGFDPSMSDNLAL